MQFSLPESLDKDRIHSAKFVIATKPFNNNPILWKISQDSRYRNRLSLFTRTQSSYDGIHEIESLEFLKHVLNEDHEHSRGAVLKLSVRGRFSDFGMVSTKTVMIILLS